MLGFDWGCRDGAAGTDGAGAPGEKGRAAGSAGRAALWCWCYAAWAPRAVLRGHGLGWSEPCCTRHPPLPPLLLHGPALLEAAASKPLQTVLCPAASPALLHQESSPQPHGPAPLLRGCPILGPGVPAPHKHHARGCRPCQGQGHRGFPLLAGQPGVLGALFYDKKKHAVVSVLGDSISHGSCSEEGGAEGAAAWGQTLSEDGPLQEDCDPELWFGCISDFGTLITVSVLRYNSRTALAHTGVSPWHVLLTEVLLCRAYSQINKIGRRVIFN